MDEILYICLSQSLFAGILIAMKKPTTMANQVLAAWFFLICIEAIIIIINSTFIELYSIKMLPFTYGPLMYLYAKFMTSEKPHFKFTFLFHFLPFFIFFVVSLIFLNKPVMEGTKGFLITDRFISLRIIYGMSFFVSVTSYSILTYIEIHRHRKRLKTVLSYSSKKVTLQWLLGLSIVFYLSYILVFIVGLIDILLNFMPFDPYELSFIGLAIFAYLYGFFGFNQPSIFGEVVKEPEEKEIAVPKKYSKSGLKEKDIESLKERIIRYMDQKKPYLERELSIGDVAKELKIPRHFITEIINNHMGKNFYYLVNEYRVREFKERLEDPANSNLTILAIAYDSGFNSKSAFNTVFKDMTGMTPSQYLRSELE